MNEVKTTHIYYLLDKSGSMQSIRDSVIQGWNDFIEEQKKIPGKLRVTMVQFDMVGWEAPDYFIPFEAANVRKNDVSLNRDNYVPGGSTPLLDAMAETIRSAEKRAADRKKDGKSEELIIFVTMTDGYENASRNTTNEQLKAMVDKKTADGWAFIYLGANQDAFGVGAGLGISGGNTSGYVATASGTSQILNTLSRSVGGYRTQVYAGAAVDNTKVLVDSEV